jgi:hypothetical protein
MFDLTLRQELLTTLLFPQTYIKLWFAYGELVGLALQVVALLTILGAVTAVVMHRELLM